MASEHTIDPLVESRYSHGLISVQIVCVRVGSIHVKFEVCMLWLFLFGEKIGRIDIKEKTSLSTFSKDSGTVERLHLSIISGAV